MRIIRKNQILNKCIFFNESIDIIYELCYFIQKRKFIVENVTGIISLFKVFLVLKRDIFRVKCVKSLFKTDFRVNKYFERQKGDNEGEFKSVILFFKAGGSTTLYKYSGGTCDFPAKSESCDQFSGEGAGNQIICETGQRGGSDEIWSDFQGICR